MITQITAQNIKGETFCHQLGAATAIVGPNFKGKTAIVEAIRLAIMGYLPEIGKQTRATWELSSGPEMDVQISFNDAPLMARHFYLDGEVVKHSLIGTPPECGNLMNAEAYFNMTDSDRTNFVFGQIKLPDSYTPEAIVSEVERMSFDAAHTEQIQLAKQNAVADVMECFLPKDERAGDPSLPSTKPSIQDALLRAVEKFREKFTQWNRKAKETKGAVTTLTELKLRETTVVTAARDVDGKIKVARERIQEINTEIGKLAAEAAANDRNGLKKKQLKAWLNEDRVDYLREIEKLRAQIQPATGKVMSAEQLRLTESSIARLHAAEREASDVVAVSSSELDKVKSELAELNAMECCPKCKAAGKGWRKQIKDGLKATNESEGKKLTEARTRADECKTQLANIQFRLEAALAADGVAKQTQRIELAIKGLETEQARNTERRREWSKELADLEALPEGREDYATLRLDLISKRQFEDGNVAEWETYKTAETQLRQDLKRAAQAEIEHQAAAAQVVVVKAVGKLLLEKREAMVAEAFTKLLRVANTVVGEILKAPLALHENTIGMFIGAKFVPHRVFSGVERTLTYIAIAVALSSEAKLKLVILDEMARLTVKLRDSVFERLVTLMETGVIDQTIVVIPSDNPLTLPNPWTLIAL